MASDKCTSNPGRADVLEYQGKLGNLTFSAVADGLSVVRNKVNVTEVTDACNTLVELAKDCFNNPGDVSDTPFLDDGEGVCMESTEAVCPTRGTAISYGYTPFSDGRAAFYAEGLWPKVAETGSWKKSAEKYTGEILSGVSYRSKEGDIDPRIMRCAIKGMQAIENAAHPIVNPEEVDHSVRDNALIATGAIAGVIAADAACFNGRGRKKCGRGLANLGHALCHPIEMAGNVAHFVAFAACNPLVTLRVAASNIANNVTTAAREVPQSPAADVARALCAGSRRRAAMRNAYYQPLREGGDTTVAVEMTSSDPQGTTTDAELDAAKVAVTRMANVTEAVPAGIGRA
jgi:hypothetical protein